MSLNKASCRSGLIGTLLSLAFATFLVSDASAQDQYCECHDAYSTAAVRRAPVRRSVRKHRKTRYSTLARRTTTIVRPAYQTVYIPVREVEYTPRYVEYVDDDDCDDVEYTSARRVIVTDRVYPVARNVYYTSGRKAYYPNGYNGDRVLVTNTHARVYLNGSYSNLEVDPDYFSTARIASDYGYRDGFDDGHEVAMERETYFPEKEGDFRNGTNAYEGHFGSKHLYKQAYRDAYLKGYNAGFRKVAQSATYRTSRW